jgi:hypothetical protein
MIQVLLRVTRAIGVLCVVFYCIFCGAVTPALAQLTRTTYTLNGLSATVVAPQAPVRLGEAFLLAVELRANGDPALTGAGVVLDGRPLGRRDGQVLPRGYAIGIPDDFEWFSSASIYATPGDVVVRLTVSEATGRGGVIDFPLRLLPGVDADGDTLPDLWERLFGLSAESASESDGALGDPDGDGVRNRDEFLRHTHPRGFHTRYFPEGVADGAFFGTAVLQMSPPGTSPRMQIRTVDADGFASSVATYNIPSTGEPPYFPNEGTRATGSSFATVIESDGPFAAERSTRLAGHTTPSGLGYGSHASEGTASLSTRWLFAEGVIGAFHTYVALLNPSTETAHLTVTYFGANGATPVVRQHVVAPDSRATIDVNADAAGLASTDLSIAIDSDVPIAAERSLYRDVGSLFWGAATSSVGAPAPAAEWFFAEGLANAFFDTYLLLLNPGTTPAQVEIEVLQAEGGPITLTRTLAPRSRTTVHVNSASPALASPSSSFGLAVRSINGAPIVAERTMWWDDPVRGTQWVEGHTSMGTPAPATRWLAPQNILTGPADDVSVYLLLANPGATPATVRVTLPATFQGASSADAMMTVPAHGRATLDVTGTFVWQPGRPDGRFNPLLVESIGDTPVPIVAERSVYANTLDAVWELGSNTLLTPLPPLPSSPVTP